MKRMLINAIQRDELRVAITNNSQLIDLDIETLGQETKKSNIYKGIIASIEPSLGAVFINYGDTRHGFLPLKAISREYFLRDVPPGLESSVDLHQVLRIGQELVVQIDKEERGTKGAALTTFISLAGSFLVLMPNNPRAAGISRQIDGENRDQLRAISQELNLPEGMGLIVRTAGMGRTKEELEWDLSVLLRYWEAIKQAAIARPGPYLIHQESDVVIRAIRDYLRQDIQEILIDEPAAYERARHYISQVRPNFMDRLRLYSDPWPLFSRFHIEQQIENAYQNVVTLPSGGSLIINHTEALVAIDINSAKATRGASLEETALNTNLEAAEEIARQLRIRDIGGLVVIDFIDMTPSRNQREVENRFRQTTQHDRARIQIGRISRFGLLEMSRQRLRTAFTRTAQITCSRCNGQGTVRTTESLGISILHTIQQEAAKAKHVHFHVQLPLDVATYLLNEKREMLKEIENLCQGKIVIIPNQYLESPHYDIKQTKIDPSQEPTRGFASYQIAKTMRIEPLPKKIETKPAAEPAVHQFLPDTNSGVPSLPIPHVGLFKRLMAKLFGYDESTEKQRGSSTKENKFNDDNLKPEVTRAGQHKTHPQHKPRDRNRKHFHDTKDRARRGTRGGRYKKEFRQHSVSPQEKEHRRNRFAQEPTSENREFGPPEETTPPQNRSERLPAHDEPTSNSSFESAHGESRGHHLPSDFLLSDNIPTLDPEEEKNPDEKA